MAMLLVTACGVDDGESASDEAGGPAANGEAVENRGDADEASAPEGVELIASDLDAPWSIAFWGSTPLISERDSGRILELDPEGEAREVSVIDDLPQTSEGGLLGLAIGEDDYLYVFSTRTEANEISRFQLSGEPGAIELGEEELLLGGIPLGMVHNGGRVEFGPDGMLYATTGDASEPDLAQNLDSLAGKILRMTPDGEIPDDNPFPDSYVYSYGHRNGQGIDWAPDGTMFAAEFGADDWDELNIIEPGGNYGWPITEGAGGDEEHIDPVQQWSPADSSPSGLAIHDEAVYIAKLRGSSLYEVPLADPTSHERHFTDEFGRIREVVTTPDGELWILTNNTDGRGTPEAGDDRILQIEVGNLGEE